MTNTDNIMQRHVFRVVTGSFTSGSESSRDGTLIPGSKSSMEVSLPRMKVIGNFHSHVIH